MTPEERQEIQAHVRAISKILYQNTPQEQLQSFKSIEITVREQILQEVAPKIGEFFLTKGKKSRLQGQEQSKVV